MSSLVSAAMMAMGLASASAAEPVSFHGSALVNGSRVAIRYHPFPATRPGNATSIVTVNSTVFRLVCAEVEVLGGRARTGERGAPEVAFWGRGVAADGSVVLIAARDGARIDQAGFLLTKRSGPIAVPRCGAGNLPITPIKSGQWVAVTTVPDPGLPPLGSGLLGHRRILTYNVGFLHATATYPSGIPPLLPCASSCDPFVPPPSPIPCGCSEMTVWPNDHRFANLGEVERAEKIAERIVATEQDVVVLNEVFHPGARAALVQGLAVSGPYKHYISLFRGHAPTEGLTLNDIAAEELAGDSIFLKALLGNLPDFLDYDAVPNPSGIAIFSKYPFLHLQGANIVDDGVCSDPECQIVGQNAGAPIQPGFYAFDVFDDCSSVDCWASKGAGLVKIDTPGEPIYVAFTHLQADYPEDEKFFPQTRAAQLEAIRDLIVGAVPATEIAAAAIYVAGDINIAGASRTSSQSGTTQEWHDAYNRNSINGNEAGGFYACGNGVPSGGSTFFCQYGVNGPWKLTDSWGFESSPTDRGISNETPSHAPNGDPLPHGARLDYVLHSDSRRRCMQHAMIAWDLQADPYGNGGLAWLSDHLPVRVDFGRAATWCSPNDDDEAALPNRNVHEFTFGPLNCGGPPNPPCDQDEIVAPPQARLAAPGAVQWFRISQAGTYSIDLDPLNGPVDIVVYHHTDLSRPIAPFETREGEFGIVYNLAEPPYYLRTFAVDASGRPDYAAANREYALRVHQHLCRSPQDACVIDPGLAIDAPTTYTWPHTVNLMTELRELWWRFKTSGVAGGRLRAGSTPGILFPTVKMQMEGLLGAYECITQVPPVIERWNDHLFPSVLEETIPFATVEVDADQDWEDDGFRDDLQVAPDLPGKVDDEFQVYFLKVTRNSDWQDGFNPCNQGLQSFVSYHTDLTYITPRTLQMYAELDDDPGDEDNLLLHMEWEGTSFQAFPPPAESAATALDEPSEGATSTELYGYAQLKGYYVERVWPTIWEQDEAELILPWEPFGPFTGIDTLSPWLVSEPGKTNPTVPQLQYSDGPNADDADYFYYLSYRRCHLATEPACANP